MSIPLRIDSQANTPQRHRREAQILGKLLTQALSVGGAGTIQLSNGSGGFEAGPTIAYLEPLTTKGDIYTYTTMPARLPVGTNGQVLESNSATTTGLQWVTAPTPTASAGTIDQVQLSDGAGGFIVGSQPLTLTSTGPALTLSTTANEFIISTNAEFLVTTADYTGGVLQALSGGQFTIGDVAGAVNRTTITVDDSLQTVTTSAVNGVSLSPGFIANFDGTFSSIGDINGTGIVTNDSAETIAATAANGVTLASPTSTYTFAVVASTPAFGLPGLQMTSTTGNANFDFTDTGVFGVSGSEALIGIGDRGAGFGSGYALYVTSGHLYFFSILYNTNLLVLDALGVLYLVNQINMQNNTIVNLSTTSAPSTTTLGILPLTVYGAGTDVLTSPDGWLSINGKRVPYYN